MEVRLLLTESWWAPPAGVTAVLIQIMLECTPESPLMSTGFKQPRRTIQDKTIENTQTLRILLSKTNLTPLLILDMTYCYCAYELLVVGYKTQIFYK